MDKLTLELTFVVDVLLVFATVFVLLLGCTTVMT